MSMNISGIDGDVLILGLALFVGIGAFLVLLLMESFRKNPKWDK